MKKKKKLFPSKFNQMSFSQFTQVSALEPQARASALWGRQHTRLGGATALLLFCCGGEIRVENLGFTRIVKQEESGTVYASDGQLEGREPKVGHRVFLIGSELLEKYLAFDSTF